MKKLFFLFLSCLLLSACMGEEVETQITVDEISLSENETLDFSFYLSRPDLGLSHLDYKEANEVEHVYMSDLPEDLQVYFVKISGIDDRDPDSGTLCRATGIPLGCPVNLRDYEQPYLVKVTYENGDYSLTEVTVPVPEFLETPTIVGPSVAPEQNSDLELSFKDIGADKYEVEVYNCDEYQNNGISPCLNNSNYTITMESGVPEIFMYNWEEDVSTYQPSVSMENGVITLKSSFQMVYAVNVKYFIYASKKTEMGYRKISDSVEFERLYKD